VLRREAFPPQWVYGRGHGGDLLGNLVWIEGRRESIAQNDDRDALIDEMPDGCQAPAVVAGGSAAVAVLVEVPAQPSP
jgi:hypothetical protein